MTPHLPCSKSIESPEGFGALWTLAWCVLLAGCGGGGDDAALASVATVPVVRGNLRINVIEGGDLDSGNPVSVRSEVEGRAAILALVAEGTKVSKGDFLVRLDNSSIQDNLNRQEIKVEDARSGLMQAEEAVAIQRKKNEEDGKAAQTNYDLAKSAYEGYVNKGGSFELESRKLESALILAREKFERAKEKAEASERLEKKEYISSTEYKADMLAMNQVNEDVNIAQASLKHFLEYTSEDEKKKLISDRDVKELALSRVKQQSLGELKQKEDTKSNKEKGYRLETEQRDKLKAQLERTSILSPSDGLVVYARSDRGGRMGGSEPIGLGKEVREQEEILRIPDLTQMVVQVNIHESSIKKIQPGQRAWVRVDALPNRQIPGVVTRVSLVPSTQGSWMNPDLKVYETIVKLEETTEGLKPGMHAQVEVLVQEIADALQVPHVAVRQSGSRSFVYVKEPNAKPQLREVKPGLNNSSNVHILEGLKEGEVVFLSVPPGAPGLPAVEAQPFLEPNAPPVGPASGAGAGVGAGGGRVFNDGNMPTGPGGGAGQPSAEQMQSMRDKMKNATPEEQQKMRDEMKKRRGDRGNRENPPTPATGGGNGGAP